MVLHSCADTFYLIHSAESTGQVCCCSSPTSSQTSLCWAGILAPNDCLALTTVVTVFSFVSRQVLGFCRFSAFAPVADGFGLLLQSGIWRESSFLSLPQRPPTFVGTQEWKGFCPLPPERQLPFYSYQKEPIFGLKLVEGVLFSSFRGRQPFLSKQGEGPGNSGFFFASPRGTCLFCVASQKGLAAFCPISPWQLIAISHLCTGWVIDVLLKDGYSIQYSIQLAPREEHIHFSCPASYLPHGEGLQKRAVRMRENSPCIWASHVIYTVTLALKSVHNPLLGLSYYLGTSAPWWVTERFRLLSVSGLEWHSAADLCILSVSRNFF